MNFVSIEGDTMESILDQIQSPKDLESLQPDELEQLASEIRAFLIDTVSRTGGHLASNLGVVELTLALHRAYDTYRDKIIWDVGHQTYVHKLLTGRKDQFHTLRQYGGLSGFPKRHESIHDHFNTGHSATSISAALGMAAARDLKGETHRVAAVIGDGALTGGMAFEALNHAGQSHRNLTVVLNDNKMSISRNVGGLSNYLTRIRTMPVYSKIKEDLEQFMDHFSLGKTVYRTAEKAKDSIKYFFVPGILFEELGFTYIGPVDGHNLVDLREAFRLAARTEGPKLIHVLTVKGKGYQPAEKFPAKFHGVNAFDPDTGTRTSSAGKVSFSEVAGNALEQAAEKDQRVVAITAAMPEGTGLNTFEHRFPKRFFDVGIAEQHAVTFAAGQAAAGLRPYFAVYSSFLQRGYDQVVHDVCLQKLPVVFLVDRAGLVGNDGETHHGVFDVSSLTAIPHLTIMAPSDDVELETMIEQSLSLEGPSVIRYPRGEAFTLTGTRPPLAVGRGRVIRHDGNDFLIIAMGTMCRSGLKVLELAREHGLSGKLLDPRYLKPLDEALILTEADETTQILVLEENQFTGGLGMQIQSLFQREQRSTLVQVAAIPDQFTGHGDQDQLYDELGFTPEKLVKRLLNASDKIKLNTAQGRSTVVNLHGSDKVGKSAYGKAAN